MSLLLECMDASVETSIWSGSGIVFKKASDPTQCVTVKGWTGESREAVFVHGCWNPETHSIICGSAGLRHFNVMVEMSGGPPRWCKAEDAPGMVLRAPSIFCPVLGRKAPFLPLSLPSPLHARSGALDGR